MDKNPLIEALDNEGFSDKVLGDKDPLTEAMNDKGFSGEELGDEDSDKDNICS